MPTPPPRDVKEIGCRAAKRLGIPTILVANERLDPRGEEHTEETIGERLSVRNLMESFRSAGVVTGGPPPWHSRDKQAFAGALDRVLTRLRRS